MDDFPRVTKQEAGTYRQLAHKIRIQGRDGQPDRNEVRPRNNAGRFLDSDDDPKTLKLDEGDRADVPALLRTGAIAPHSARTVKVAEKLAAEPKAV